MLADDAVVAAVFAAARFPARPRPRRRRLAGGGVAAAHLVQNLLDAQLFGRGIFRLPLEGDLEGQSLINPRVARCMWARLPDEKKNFAAGSRLFPSAVGVCACAQACPSSD